MSSQTTDRRQNATATPSVIDQPTTTREGALTEDRDTLVQLFRQMLLIRRFEEKCAESYSLGKIGGFCHLYIGQEAVGVGAISALRPDDTLLQAIENTARLWRKACRRTRSWLSCTGKPLAARKARAARCTCSTLV